MGDLGSIGVLRLRAARSAQDDGENNRNGESRFPSGMTGKTGDGRLKTGDGKGEEQGTAKATANAGVSPLRHAMRLRGFGRDDVYFRVEGWEFKEVKCEEGQPEPSLP